jgi:hypothetical protein
MDHRYHVRRSEGNDDSGKNQDIMPIHNQARATRRSFKTVQHAGIAWNHSGQSANKTERYPAIAREWGFLMLLYNHRANVIIRVN